MSEYPRTDNGFRRAWDAVTFHLGFHNTPIWLYVADHSYVVSVVRPEVKALATGTAAILHGPDNTELDRIVGGTAA